MTDSYRKQVLRLVGGRSIDRPDALAELAASAAGGDRRAVRTFLATVTPHLLRVVRKVMGAHHPDVDDVTQEAVFAVVEAIPRYRGECTVLHFACRIAVLTAMSARRRHMAGKRAAGTDAIDAQLVPSSSPGPDAELIAQARAETVRELLDSLPTEQAEVLALHCVLGYTVREIAETARAPLETIRSRLRLAKQALRERIHEDPELQAIVGEPPA